MGRHDNVLVAEFSIGIHGNFGEGLGKMIEGAMGQIFLLAFEILVVSLFLLAFFRLRGLFGLSPLYIALGVFQPVQVILVLSVYVQIGPNLFVSPGSVVLFTASLFVVLLVYIREDAIEARKLIYGLIASNFILSGLGLLFVMHSELSPHQLVAQIPETFFIHDPKILLVGSLVLFCDALLIMYLFEAISRLSVRWLFFRILITMSIVLFFDTVLFLGWAFRDAPHLINLIQSGLVGKLMAGFIYSSVFTFFLKYFDSPGREDLAKAPPGFRDVFGLLTYRQKFDILRIEITRDPLTGVFNRGYFNSVLTQELETAEIHKTSLTLLMIDVDHFKRINDQFGHLQGDEAIKFLARTLRDAVRSSDIVCRYGGEEFGVILLNQSLEEGVLLGERIRKTVIAESAKLPFLDKNDFLTVSIGVASYPEGGTSMDTLVEEADRRLFMGKKQGRNRVVSCRVA